MVSDPHKLAERIIDGEIDQSDLSGLEKLWKSLCGSHSGLIDRAREKVERLKSEAQQRVTRLAEIFQELRESIGWQSIYTDDYFERILATKSFNRATIKQVFVLAQLCQDLGPITVRGAMYRGTQSGVYPGTDDEHYRSAQGIILKLRRLGLLPYSKIADSTRRRLKPSSWSGLGDFLETVQEGYRKDLWAKQKDYIEFFVEKDAMAGVLEPATREYDVVLNIVRGGCSETLLWNIAEEWNEIKKPITAYYFGDHDPSGLLIEQDIRKRLEGFCKRPFDWHRLGITTEDFFDSNILGFPIKRPKGERSMKVWHTKNDPYIATYGDRCVEVDALSPEVCRQRIKDAIESHIDMKKWEKLKQTEALEKESVAKLPKLLKL